MGGAVFKILFLLLLTMRCAVLHHYNSAKNTRYCEMVDLKISSDVKMSLLEGKIS